MTDIASPSYIGHFIPEDTPNGCFYKTNDKEMIAVAHEVESMFYTREAPWHGLGNRVDYALSSEEALWAAGLDWEVLQKLILTDDGIEVAGFKANVRSTDNQVLGVVSNRYSIVNNNEAFAFTDELLGEGVRYETAGSLQNGRKVWFLAKLPDINIVAGDRITPYLVFANAMTPIRIVCQNTLNLTLNSAKRIWITIHIGDMKSKLDEAKKTILLADHYMDRLGAEIDCLTQIKIPDHKIQDYIDFLLPLQENSSPLQASTRTDCARIC